MASYITISPRALQNIHYPFSPTESIVSSTSDMIFGENATTPYLEILIQPTDKFRFRYSSEKGSHGKILGESQPKVKKMFPTVKLHNYTSARKVFVKVDLYTSEDNPKPHVLELVGKECKDGVYYEKLDKTFCAKFKDMSILNKKKDEILQILEERKKRGISSVNQLNFQEEIQDEAKNLNLNAVKLGFEAVFEDNLFPVPGCPKIFSNTIFNLKSTYTGDLGICRLSMSSGKCSGQEEMILLCNKIKKDEIQILFIEKDENDCTLWSAEAPFHPSDVHHQVAIPFRTPKYEGQHSETLREGDKATVWIQLHRKSDGKCGKPVQFEYRCERSEISKKRKLCDYPLKDFQFSEKLNSFLMTSNDDFKSLNSNDLCPDPFFESDGPNLDHSTLYSELMNMNPIETCDFRNFDIQEIISFPSSNEEFVKKDAVETKVDHDRSHPQSSTFQHDTSSRPIHNMSEVNNQFEFMSLNEDDRSNGPSTRKDALSFGISSLLRNKTISYYSLDSPSIQDHHGNSLLHLAIMEDRHMGFINKILVAILEEKFVNHKNDKKETALHLAIHRNHVQLLQMLLHFGGNPNITDKDGNNCLHLASIHNSTECMEKLLYVKEKLCSHAINSLNFDGMTPLHLSVIKNSEGCMKALLNAKADINACENKCGRTSLHLAVEFKSSFLRHLLLQPDIDVEIEDYRGCTALQTACNENDISYKNLPSEVKRDKQQMGLFLMKLFGEAKSSLHSAEENTTESEDSEKEDFQCKVELFLNRHLLWKKLGVITGADEKELHILGELEKNPAKALIEKIKDNDMGDTKKDLLEILNMAGLSDAVKCLSE